MKDALIDYIEIDKILIMMDYDGVFCSIIH
jgi:hypothetical protein